jgi:hypothetical protein
MYVSSVLIASWSRCNLVLSHPLTIDALYRDTYRQSAFQLGWVFVLIQEHWVLWNLTKETLLTYTYAHEQAGNKHIQCLAKRPSISISCLICLCTCFNLVSIFLISEPYFTYLLTSILLVNSSVTSVWDPISASILVHYSSNRRPEDGVLNAETCCFSNI